MEHWNAALKILVYVASTLDGGLSYRRNASAKLVTVTDTDFAGDPVERRSVVRLRLFDGGSSHVLEIFANLNCRSLHIGAQVCVN